MRKWVVYLGLVLAGIGVIGMIVGLAARPAQISSTAPSISSLDAAALCHPGETLATEQGPESYNDEDGIYSRHTVFNCVNAAGIKRDVTSKVAQGAVNGLVNTVGSLLIPILSFVLCSVGVIILIIAAFVSRHRARQTTRPA